MNIHIKYFFVLLTVFCENNVLYAKDQSIDPDAISSVVKKIASPFMRQYQIPGLAIALCVHDNSYLFHFGYANKKDKIPVTQNTLFELGSITKLFTCLLIAQEVEKGNMKLTEPISSYIPCLSTNKNLHTITLERLGTHTANLPFNAPAWIKSKKDLLKHIASWRPEVTLPLSWRYSNHGIELLAIALEESLHESYNDLLKKEC